MGRKICQRIWPDRNLASRSHEPGCGTPTCPISAGNRARHRRSGWINSQKKKWKKAIEAMREDGLETEARALSKLLRKALCWLPNIRFDTDPPCDNRSRHYSSLLSGCSSFSFVPDGTLGQCTAAVSLRMCSCLLLHGAKVSLSRPVVNLVFLCRTPLTTPLAELLTFSSLVSLSPSPFAPLWPVPFSLLFCYSELSSESLSRPSSFIDDSQSHRHACSARRRGGSLPCGRL